MEKKPKQKFDEELVGEIVDDIIIDKFEPKKEKQDPDGEIVDDFVIDGDSAELIAKKLNMDLAASKELNQLYMDKIRHQAAEFENYRNRTSKEMGQVFDKGVREIAAALLPITDNFQRALKNADTKDPFVAGMTMIESQLHTMLESMDIKKIPSVGEVFDTKYHSAVSHIADDSLGEGIVAEELAAGYIHKDSVIRHAVVVVAN